jgi:sulfoxide reductase heme-binding subunit YedZ
MASSPAFTSSPVVRRRLLRAASLALGLGPLVWLGAAVATDGLGANPIEAITHFSGGWALRFLLLCLCVTPLRRLSGWRALTLERRTLGLFAFLYALIHLATYVVLDRELDLATVAEDVLERPYITVGFASFLILLALALTSTRAAARRLGRRWKILHRSVYAAAIGGVVHFLWLVKSDLREPLLYGAVVGALLGIRIWWRISRPTTPLACPRVRGRSL